MSNGLCWQMAQQQDQHLHPIGVSVHLIAICWTGHVRNVASVEDREDTIATGCPARRRAPHPRRVCSPELAPGRYRPSLSRAKPHFLIVFLCVLGVLCG